MANDIIVISDDIENAEFISRKMSLLRSNDGVSICEAADIKQITESNYRIAILYHAKAENTDSTLKLCKKIKEISPETEIILATENIDSEFIFAAYDTGVYDYYYAEAEDYDLILKILACIKYITLRENYNVQTEILTNLGVMDFKTGLYRSKYIKDIFPELINNQNIQNGVFVILSLDENIKTKISTNRLAGILKKNIRQNDIVSIDREGYFYLILKNANIGGAKSLLNKIQQNIGSDMKIHAGCGYIGTNSFEELYKDTKDSFTIATKNDELCVSIKNSNLTDDWLEIESPEKSKKFKLFQNMYEFKVKNIIEPGFYRFQKECEALKNTSISQYANNIESVYCLKGKNGQSELTIHYNGFTTLDMEITHSGLNSAENSKHEISLNKLNDRELYKLLKKLKKEYSQNQEK